MEFLPKEFTALSILVRGNVIGAKYADYNSITKTLSGDALLAAKLMFNQPLSRNDKLRQKEFEPVLQHLREWANKLPRIGVNGYERTD